AAEAGHHTEAILLRVVEARVKRCRRVGDLLEHGAAPAHGVGDTLEPLDRIARLRLRPVACSLTRLDTVDAILGGRAQRLLECRPVLLLVGTEREPGVQPRDPRVGKGAHVVRAKPSPLTVAAAPA